MGIKLAASFDFPAEEVCPRLLFVDDVPGAPSVN